MKKLLFLSFVLVSLAGCKCAECKLDGTTQAGDPVTYKTERFCGTSLSDIEGQYEGWESNGQQYGGTWHCD